MLGLRLVDMGCLPAEVARTQPPHRLRDLRPGACRLAPPRRIAHRRPAGRPQRVQRRGLPATQERHPGGPPPAEPAGEPGGRPPGPQNTPPPGLGFDGVFESGIGAAVRGRPPLVRGGGRVNIIW